MDIMSLLDCDLRLVTAKFFYEIPGKRLVHPYCWQFADAIPRGEMFSGSFTIWEREKDYLQKFLEDSSLSELPPEKLRHLEEEGFSFRRHITRRVFDQTRGFLVLRHHLNFWDTELDAELLSVDVEHSPSENLKLRHVDTVIEDEKKK
jgi:uncharacterized protein Usg